MEITKVKIEDLHLDPSNARKHDSKNLDAIKSSLAKFGQQKAIVIDKNNVVIAGNGTLEAAKALGWTDIAVVVSDLKGAEAMAFAIADNRTTDLSSFDEDILGMHLQALREDDWDLGDLGFDINDLVDFGVTDAEKEAIEDDVPEPPKDVWLKPGDLFLLDPYLECDSCKEKFPYDKSKVDTGCPKCSK